MFGKSSKPTVVLSVVRPERIDEILSVVDMVCQGDFEARIMNEPVEEGAERQLCLKINEMIDRADAYVRESTACLGFITENQYFRRIAEHGMLGAYGEASRAINAAADGIEIKMKKFAEMVETINSAAAKLNASALSLGDTANLTKEKATTVSAAAEEAGSNTQTVASAAEELNASIQEINRQVAQSTSMAADAVAEAEKANELVNGLSKVSQEIEGMVSLINDIADQTNLLALNATIETARAGDAGKGFAVVASEVKSLAGKTANATDEIKSQVAQIQSATGTAVHSIVDICKKVAAFNESAGAIAAAIEEQGAATQEIAHNVQEASSGVTEVKSSIVGVSDNIGQVNQITQEVTAVANELTGQAEDLAQVLNG